MALMKCPNCNEEIEEKLDKCPKCGKDLVKVKDEGRFRKRYIVVPVILLFIIIGVCSWYIMSMDKRVAIDASKVLEKDGYTCTLENTEERKKVNKKYIFGTSEVADIHCYKEDNEKVFVYEIFFVDSYRYNFYVIENKDYKKEGDTYIFRLSGLDYEITKQQITNCANKTNEEPTEGQQEQKEEKDDKVNNCKDYSENAKVYLDMYTKFMDDNNIKIDSQHAK